jgi:hypothetical protein
MSCAGWGSVAGVLLAIAGAAAQGTAGHSGAVNYIEGQVSLEGKPLASGALEGIALGAGQTLSTEQGKAEVLLTPGAFLRLGDQTSIKMSSESAADARVEILQGAALLEVVQLGGAHLEVLDGQAHATIQSAGVYEFHAGQPAVAVVSGKARVQANDHAVELGKGREVTWRGSAAGNEGKIPRASLAADALYAWSQQRARADAEASVNTAQALVGTDPGNWHGAGWYWDPFYANWAFLPATYTLSGPFGEEYFSARFYWEYAAAEPHSHGYFEAAQ